jgi:hypothetical protein
VLGAGLAGSAAGAWWAQRDHTRADATGDAR